MWFFKDSLKKIKFQFESRYFFCNASVSSSDHQTSGNKVLSASCINGWRYLPADDDNGLTRRPKVVHFPELWVLLHSKGFLRGTMGGTPQYRVLWCFYHGKYAFVREKSELHNTGRSCRRFRWDYVEGSCLSPPLILPNNLDGGDSGIQSRWTASDHCGGFPASNMFLDVISGPCSTVISAYHNDFQWIWLDAGLLSYRDVADFGTFSGRPQETLRNTPWLFITPMIMVMCFLQDVVQHTQ